MSRRDIRGLVAIAILGIAAGALFIRDRNMNLVECVYEAEDTENLSRLGWIWDCFTFDYVPQTIVAVCALAALIWLLVSWRRG